MPKLLILGGPQAQQHDIAQRLGDLFEITETNSVDDAIAALRQEDFDIVMAESGDFLPLERALVDDKATLVLDTIGEGVCVVDSESRFVWTNKRMRGYPGDVGEQVKKIASQALAIFTQQTGGSESVTSRSKKFAFQVKERFFEMMCSPVIHRDHDGNSSIEQIVGVVWDNTSSKRLQSKVDVIDAAGRELARIEGEAIEKLTPPDRLKLLEDKIVKFSKDLMHFDHFAIRVLDKRDNRLEVVMAEGLPLEALEIDLYATPEGNGISGYVGHTGRSYICHDTEKDARYVLGLTHGKSSLTVPLKLFDRVIGVYNVESERVGAFDEDDRQFAEIFGRYVAMALHILDLLVTERFTTSGQITENVVHQMTGPMGDIVTEAQSLMEDYIGDDAMRQRLTRIIDSVGSIKQAVNAVAAGPNTVLGTSDDPVQTEDGPEFAGKRVLIADDEPNIRRTIGEVLGKYGCETEICKDGYEACSALEQMPYDLVISDIKMPYRNGYEIYAVAQRSREGTPVILMTGFGYDPNHAIVRASQEGLNSVLFKPFKVDQLLEEVRKAFNPDPKPSNDPQVKTT